MRKALFMFVAVGAMACGVAGMRAHAFAASEPLAVGSVAPDFKLPTQVDNVTASLKDYKGKYVVLYFYPKDMTTGCTIEAHNFERDTEKYSKLNAVVLGVSLDTVESHKTFCSKDGLNFKLLADPDHKVIDAYGVPVSARGEMKFAARDTYLIGPNGKVLKFWEVKDVNKHSDEILAAIEEVRK